MSKGEMEEEQSEEIEIDEKTMGSLNELVKSGVYKNIEEAVCEYRLRIERRETKRR